jgi:signal peptidase I
MEKSSPEVEAKTSIDAGLAETVLLEKSVTGATRNADRNSAGTPHADNATPGRKSPRSEIAEVISFFKTLSLFLLAAFLLQASVVQAFKIPSGSMIPTLKVGDHIFVSKFSYGLRLPFMTHTFWQYAMPKRGDVVVFTRPDDPLTPDEDDSDVNIIKRVIGLPGDLLEIQGTRVYINNQLLIEEYAKWDEQGLTSQKFGPEKVPEGHIFLMGDNRDHSKDSRFWTQPFLDINRVKGRALIIYWNFSPRDLLSRMGKVIR